MKRNTLTTLCPSWPVTFVRVEMSCRWARPSWQFLQAPQLGLLPLTWSSPSKLLQMHIGSWGFLLHLEANAEPIKGPTDCCNLSFLCLLIQTHLTVLSLFLTAIWSHWSAFSSGMHQLLPCLRASVLTILSSWTHLPGSLRSILLILQSHRRNVPSTERRHILSQVPLFPSFEPIYPSWHLHQFAITNLFVWLVT